MEVRQKLSDFCLVTVSCYNVHFHYAVWLHSNPAHHGELQRCVVGIKAWKMCFCNNKCYSRAPDNRRALQCCVFIILLTAKIIWHWW